MAFHLFSSFSSAAEVMEAGGGLHRQQTKGGTMVLSSLLLHLAITLR